MTISLSNLRSPRGSRKRKKRLGRGNASGHGTYSTRGQKGQKARSGGRKGLKALGLKMVLRTIPKKRGFSSLNKPYSVISVSILDKHFTDGAEIGPKEFLLKGLIKGREAGKVKIVGGEVTKALIVKAHAYSESAIKAILGAGGKVIVI